MNQFRYNMIVSCVKQSEQMQPYSSHLTYEGKFVWFTYASLSFLELVGTFIFFSELNIKLLISSTFLKIFFMQFIHNFSKEKFFELIFPDFMTAAFFKELNLFWQRVFFLMLSFTLKKIVLWNYIFCFSNVTVYFFFAYYLWYRIGLFT